MNDLPNELITFIFEHLNIQDLIQCSLVCKRFKLLCQNVKIPELIISNTTLNIKECWFHTKKQFNFQDAIDLTTFNSYRSIFRLDQFRRLYFEGSHSEYAQLNVNDLTQLEQMKIYIKPVDGIEPGAEYEIHINLPNLKMIEIDADRSLRFFITTPKLEKLRCADFDVFSLTYPNTITHLATGHYRESFHVLKNLQFLLVTITSNDFDWYNTLSAFPKLTTLACHGCTFTFPTESIKDLLRYKRNHQLSAPKVYYESVELHDVDKIDEYINLEYDEFAYRYRFLFQINNYNSLPETVFIVSDDINYNTLMDTMNGKIPDDFYQKYYSARCVHVPGKVRSQEHLLSFLKKFDYLRELHLGCSSGFTQSFYSRLDELDQLTTFSVEIHSKSTFDFDFLYKLKRLQTLKLYAESASARYYDSALELFRVLKYFSTFIYKFKECALYLGRRAPNEYEFGYNSTIKGELDFNGLVDEVKIFKSRHIKEEKNL